MTRAAFAVSTIAANHSSSANKFQRIIKNRLFGAYKKGNFWLWIQPVDAAGWLNRSAGVQR